MRNSLYCFVLAVIAIALSTPASAARPEETVEGKCMTCHKDKSPGLYYQWHSSAHALHDVTCYDCHAAEPSEPDAYEHEGAIIATLVTPKDCSACHETEAEEVGNSYHATAGEILESNDAYLAYAAGGHPAVIQGCESCHGAKVIIDPDSPNRLSMMSWPNSGIGRLNPDGSKGACSACHTRHAFEAAQARRPEAVAAGDARSGHGMPVVEATVARRRPGQRSSSWPAASSRSSLRESR